MDGTEYGAWNINLLKRYLDSLVTKNVWVGTLGATVKFVRERDSATLSLLSSTADHVVLDLHDALDDSIYDQPLTIRSELPGDSGDGQGDAEQRQRPGEHGRRARQDGRVLRRGAGPRTNHSVQDRAPDRTDRDQTEPDGPLRVAPLTGMVTLGGAALSGGVVVTLTGSNTSAACVPSSVTVPAASTSAIFRLTTPAATSAVTNRITATFGAPAGPRRVTVVFDRDGHSPNLFVEIVSGRTSNSPAAMRIGRYPLRSGSSAAILSAVSGVPRNGWRQSRGPVDCV